MKKILACLIAGLLALSSLSACSGSQSTGDASKPDESQSQGGEEGGDGEVVELEFIQQKREAVETFDAVIAKFGESHKNIKVTQNNVADAGQVLMSRAASNTLPDLMTHWPSDATFVTFCKEGRIIDITNEDFAKGMNPAYADPIKVDGKLYCVPVALNFMGVWYNVDKFEEAGYKVPKTWDDMIKIAEDIKSKGEVAFVLPDKDTWTIDQCMSNIYSKSLGDLTTQEIYDEVGTTDKTFADYPVLVDAAEKMIQLREYSDGDTLSLGYDSATSAFATGTGYMFLQGSWVYASLKGSNPDGNFAMFPVPNDDGNPKQTMGVDLAIAGTTNSKYPDQVKEFLAYMGSVEGAQLYSDLDGSPSCVDGVEPKLDYAKAVIDQFNSNGALSMSFRPGTYQDDYRAETQGLIIDKDVQGWLATVTKVFKDNYAEANG